ncbi:MAG: DUF1592 domain-containing protein, partial [Verrucomicrobiota bacterium]
MNTLNSGEMPPENKKQLTQDEKKEFLADLSTQLAVAREVLADSGGIITMRRLNRREYENTIEDLLGVRIDAGDLPDDKGSGSFDTNGASLFFSSDQLETYLRLANEALGYALVSGRPPEVQKERVEAEDLMMAKMQGEALKIAREYFAKAYPGGNIPEEPSKEVMRVAFGERPNYRWSNHVAWLNHPEAELGSPLYNLFMDFALPPVQLPYTGVKRSFRIRIKAALLDDEVPEHRRYLEYGSAGQGGRRGELNVAGFHKISGTMENPQILEFDYSPEENAQLQFGIRERHINQLNAAKRFFRDTYDNITPGVGPKPTIWVDWIEWEGPFVEEWPSRAQKEIFFPRREGLTTEEYHRDVLTTFARRAFRESTPSPGFIDRLMENYRAEVHEGKKPLKAMEEQMAIVLSSPEFLYLNEPTFGKDHKRLSDRELAVRLAYFLWSAPPDEELMSLALEERLREEGVLREQTLRLLMDPKAESFVRGFAHQWLHMERLDFFQFNYEKFPR